MPVQPCEVRVSSLDIPTKLDVVKKKTECVLNIEMKGEDIVQKCKAWYKAGGGDGALPRKKMRQFYPERPLKTGSESISKGDTTAPSNLS